MQQEHNTARVMPDVASAALPETAAALDWVGMDEIHAPIVLSNEQGDTTRTPARVAAFVNLRKPDARGIHMSRLYLHVDKALAEPLTPCSIRHMLRDFLESHADLSDRARCASRSIICCAARR